MAIETKSIGGTFSGGKLDESEASCMDSVPSETEFCDWAAF